MFKAMNESTQKFYERVNAKGLLTQHDGMNTLINFLLENGVTVESTANKSGKKDGMRAYVGKTNIRIACNGVTLYDVYARKGLIRVNLNETRVRFTADVKKACRQINEQAGTQFTHDVFVSNSSIVTFFTKSMELGK